MNKLQIVSFEFWPRGFDISNTRFYIASAAHSSNPSESAALFFGGLGCFVSVLMCIS